jgi:hypothetical protein
MDVAKTLAVGLGVSRTLFGAGNVVQPQATARANWIGRAAKKPGAQVMIRAQGMRDIALGGGAVRAAARGSGPELRAWMVAHTASDLTDLVATWAARDDLPKRRARFAITVAAISAVAGAVAAAGAARPQPPEETASKS